MSTKHTMKSTCLGRHFVAYYLSGFAKQAGYTMQFRRNEKISLKHSSYWCCDLRETYL